MEEFRLHPMPSLGSLNSVARVSSVSFLSPMGRVFQKEKETTGIQEKELVKGFPKEPLKELFKEHKGTIEGTLTALRNPEAFSCVG